VGFFAKSYNEQNETNIVRNDALLKPTDWDQYEIRYEGLLFRLYLKRRA